jgi:hypothetical protein
MPATTATVACQVPAAVLARLDELRHARQQHSTRAISRGALLREAIDVLLAQAAPAAPGARRPVAVATRCTTPRRTPEATAASRYSDVQVPVRLA